MVQRLIFTGVLALAVATPVAVSAVSVEDQVQILVERGEIKPFKDIYSRVVSQTRGDYIGAEYDTETRIYRFRFLDNGSVKNVDVDARTGQRVRRTNNF